MQRDTILDAWCKGYAAFGEGQPNGENPYPDQTKLSEVWANAWRKSRDAERVGLPAPPLSLRFGRMA